MSEIYTGIDLGTDSIKIITVEKINDKFQVLASISSPSSGIINGFIEESKPAIASIKQALKKHQDQLGVKISKVIACIPSRDCKMDIVTSTVNVIDYNEITGTDISNVFNSAIKKIDLTKNELVTAMPISFTIDEKTNIKDPKGMKGATLEGRIVVSTTPKESLYRILEVLKLSGLETVDIAFNSVGDYYSIKSRKYDELVGAIINVGELSTNISVFNKGIQIKNSIVPVGSSNVDKDISYVFKSNLKDSREIKENFSMAISTYADSNDTWEFKIDNNTKKEVNQLGVSKVVEARIREILKLAKNEIKNLTNREIRYIIITGGLTELAGFQQLAEQEFGFVAKVCNIKIIGARHNKYSSVYGITKYFDDKLSLRGKKYMMLENDDIKKMTMIDSNISSENMISKVFGHFFDN